MTFEASPSGDIEKGDLVRFPKSAYHSLPDDADQFVRDDGYIYGVVTMDEPDGDGDIKVHPISGHRPYPPPQYVNLDDCEHIFGVDEVADT